MVTKNKNPHHEIFPKVLHVSIDNDIDLIDEMETGDLSVQEAIDSIGIEFTTNIDCPELGDGNYVGIYELKKIMKTKTILVEEK